MKYILFSLFFVLTGCVSNSPPSNAPIKTSVTEILSDPWKYHGKEVVVEGTFNECLSLTCRLCDSPVPVDPYTRMRGTCLGVSFDYKSYEEQARFSTLRVRGRYDATCSGVQQDPTADEITVCTDRATQLRVSGLIEKITSRAPRQGHTSTYGTTPLNIPSLSEREAIITSFMKQTSRLTDLEQSDVEFVYSQSLPRDEKAVQGAGGVCLCLKEQGECDDIWPTLEGHTWALPADNPYQCWYAEKENGVWTFPIQ